MTKDLLWSLYPYLWHMAEPGSWPSIRRRGLLSTSTLLDEYVVDATTRAAIESRHRPASVPVRHPGLPDVVIRDQKPMSDGALLKCLQDGLTPPDWYRMLNERTFFWLSRARLRRLLGARAYRGRPQTILTLGTRSLVETHLDQIELSPINSGSTLFNPVPRGLRTFLPIGEYDFEAWRRKRPAAEAVVELVVRRGVPDAMDHILCVHDWIGDAMVEVWRRSGGDPSVSP